MASTSLWNVQKFDQTLGTYTNLDAAKAHGDHVIRDHYRPHMDRRRVPASHRVVDWRVPAAVTCTAPVSSTTRRTWSRTRSDVGRRSSVRWSCALLVRYRHAGGHRPREHRMGDLAGLRLRPVRPQRDARIAQPSP
ncbi:hypothetical protein O1L60_46135 [Streptomyces diastatochromogenes]|nr:hypothetical protein [Streptomyces diastatochromogenes]